MSVYPKVGFTESSKTKNIFCRNLESPLPQQLINLELSRGPLKLSAFGHNDLSDYLKDQDISYNFEFEGSYKFPILAGSYLEKAVDSVEILVSTKKQRRRFPFCIYTKPIRYKNWSIRGTVESHSGFLTD